MTRSECDSPVIFGVALLCFMSFFEILRQFLTASARFLIPYFLMIPVHAQS